MSELIFQTLRFRGQALGAPWETGAKDTGAPWEVTWGTEGTLELGSLRRAGWLRLLREEVAVAV